MNLNFGTPSSQEFRAYARAEGQAATTADDVVVGTWSTSGERQAYLDRRSRVIVVALPAMALAVVGYAMIKPEDRSWVEWSGTGALVVAAILLTWCLMPYWASGRAYRQRKLATAAARVDKAVEDIAAAEDLPLPMLFKLNRRQLDEYQEMTKKQQRSAFLLTQAASVAAFVALTAGVVLTFRMSADGGRYVVGGLSGLGALLSSFLAKTFYRSHQDANQQLNHYYLEPQRTGRILAAERLARWLKEEPASRYTEEMVRELLKWEMPSANGLTPPPGSEASTPAP